MCPEEDTSEFQSPICSMQLQYTYSTGRTVLCKIAPGNCSESGRWLIFFGAHFPPDSKAQCSYANEAESSKLNVCTEREPRAMASWNMSKEAFHV